MRRNAVPGQALHEGHRRTVISVGVVFTLLLQDREAPRRRAVILAARTDGAKTNGDALRYA